jgi:hypothetical protein
MKIHQLKLQELDPDHPETKATVSFQGKTFARDTDFSARVYLQMIDELQGTGDEDTPCLVVDMGGYYSIWRVVESPRTASLTLHGTMAPQFHSANTAVISQNPTKLDQEQLLSLISSVTQRVLGEVQTPQVPTTLQTLIERLKQEIPDPNVAEYLAAQLLAHMESEANTVESQAPPESVQPAPAQPQVPPRRKYRGAWY